MPASGRHHPARVHLPPTVLWDDAGMVRPDLPTDPSSPLRRRLLRAAVLAPLAATLATLPGCSLPVQVDGTFLQPWRSHLQWGPADWQRSLKLFTRGCRQLVLQWTGIVGGSDGDWSLPDSNLQQLFTAASENDIRIRVGLPFQQRWWQAIGADDATLQAFLADSLAHARSWLAQARRRAAFGGWYLPYELEQFHWADPARQQWLAQWLHGLAQAASARGGDCAISCYFSRLQTDGDLVALWQAVLARPRAAPMVQDGGVAAPQRSSCNRCSAISGHRASGSMRSSNCSANCPAARRRRRVQRNRRCRAHAARIQRQLAWARQRCAARAGLCTGAVADPGHAAGRGAATTLGPASVGGWRSRTGPWRAAYHRRRSRSGTARSGPGRNAACCSGLRGTSSARPRPALRRVTSCAAYR